MLTTLKIFSKNMVLLNFKVNIERSKKHFKYRTKNKVQSQDENWIFYIGITWAGWQQVWKVNCVQQASI